MNGHRTQESGLSAACSEILYSDMDTPIGIATLGLFALCFLDVLTTTLILSHGGYEMNPVMIRIVTFPLLHMVFKWIVVIFIAGVAEFCDRFVPRSGMLMISVVIAWYAFVVTHNLMVMLGVSFHP